MSDPKEPSLEDLLKRHLALRAAVAKDPRYKADAYAFVCEGVEYTCSKLGERRDISGRELVEGLCDLAVERFGFLAPRVLRHWGVRATEDFGEIVFTLVEYGLLGKSARDSKADFAGVLDLQKALRERYRMDDPTEE
ncbi:MAG TPA: hypothetical protein PLE19_21900 [Planctomycetota bacterium]|mgnify:CR=1 FL=1|nr:hypothetical protein [Planctomycetota bacterium]HRR82584.1 hypothetical protein [Planctomycetota bacterium]HRT95050.1 hypothetical protein [Planctomycetota bacterium]